MAQSLQQHGCIAEEHGTRATKREDVGLIVRAISFQDFQRVWSWSTNVTDGQTDDMQSQYRALHYSASRGKKKENEQKLYCRPPTCRFMTNQICLGDLLLFYKGLRGLSAIPCDSLSRSVCKFRNSTLSRLLSHSLNFLLVLIAASTLSSQEAFESGINCRRMFDPNHLFVFSFCPAKNFWVMTLRQQAWRTYAHRRIFTDERKGIFCPAPVAVCTVWVLSTL